MLNLLSAKNAKLLSFFTFSMALSIPQISLASFQEEYKSPFTVNKLNVIPQLPSELAKEVLERVKDEPTYMQIAMVDTALFGIITGCTKEDLHKPAFLPKKPFNFVESTANTKVPEALGKKGYISYPHHFLSFKKLTEEQVSKMPVYIWQGIPRRVTFLPKELWPFIKNTKIYALGFRGSQMGPFEAQDLVKNLQNSVVYCLNLMSNNIGPNGGEGLARNFQNTLVRIINLSSNKLGKNGAVSFVKNLPGTQIHTAYFSVNNIGNDGAVELAENLKNTSVRTVYLAGNNIGPETQEFLKKAFPNIKWFF